jgi:hypothetical protein
VKKANTGFNDFDISRISFLFCLTLFLSGSQVSCKTGSKQNFAKRSMERTITVSRVSGPWVIFILQSKDTLKFNKYAVAKTISNSFNNYSTGILDSLSADSNDIFVYQDLSSVGNKTIGGTLDSWVARELLLDGKATVMLTDHQRVTKLRYVETRDALGGQQCTFYGNWNRVIYSCIITFGE